MIINHPVLNRFSPAIREITPQPHDDKLVIPNSFQLTGMPPDPAFIAVPGSTNVQNTSFIMQHALTVSNGGAQLIQMATIRRGWWDITVRMSYRSDYIGPNAQGDARFIIDNGSLAIEYMTFFAMPNPGAQLSEAKFQLMIQNDFILSHFLAANGVGETHHSKLSMIANNLL